MKLSIGEIRTRPECEKLFQFLRHKYLQHRGTLVYPVMSFNFLAVGIGGGVYSVVEDDEELKDDVFGARFTLRHGIIDTFHMHDVESPTSNKEDVYVALKNFLELAFTGEPIICSEGQQVAVANFIAHNTGSGAADTLKSVFSIQELEVCLFNLVAHQFVQHYGKPHVEDLIYKEFLIMKEEHGHTVPRCCRHVAMNVIHEIYRMCRIANISSNLYVGNMRPPGIHMFGLIFPLPPAHMNPVADEGGNRLCNLNPSASEARNRQNHDPVLEEGPHAKNKQKKEKGYAVPGLQVDESGKKQK